MAPDPKVQKQITEHRRDATRLRREAEQEKLQEATAERKAIEYESQARKVALEVELTSAKGDAARARATTHEKDAADAKSWAKGTREMAERLERDAKAIEQSDPNKAAD